MGIELQQNNRLLDAQASYNLLAHRTAARNEIYFNPKFAAFGIKVASGKELSSVEQFRLNAMRGRALLGYEWEYLQFRSGNLSYLRLDAWREFMNEERWQTDVWGPKENLCEEFVDVVEREILMRK